MLTEFTMLETEYEAVLENAHKAERRMERHFEECYICGNEDYDGDLCTFGALLEDDEIGAWDFVYTHPCFKP